MAAKKTYERHAVLNTTIYAASSVQQTTYKKLLTHCVAAVGIFDNASTTSGKHSTHH